MRVLLDEMLPRKLPARTGRIGGSRVTMWAHSSSIANDHLHPSCLTRGTASAGLWLRDSVDERHLIEMGIDRESDLGCFLHVSRRFRIAEHGLEVLAPAPLGVVDDAGPVKALMGVGRDEPRLFVHRLHRIKAKGVIISALKLSRNMIMEEREKNRMAAEPRRVDITRIPDLIALTEEVQKSKEGAILQRAGKDVAELKPITQPDEEGTLFTRDDALWNIIGMDTSEGAEDMSENKHIYLADAYEA